MKNYSDLADFFKNRFYSPWSSKRSTASVGVKILIAEVRSIYSSFHPDSSPKFIFAHFEVLVKISYLSTLKPFIT